MRKTLSQSVFKSQLPVDFIDTSITINDWMTVDSNLSDGDPCKLWVLIVEQTNDSATAETLEFEITINGTAYTLTMTNAASGTAYYVSISRNLTTGDFTLAWSSSARTVGEAALGNLAVPFVADHVGLIRVRQTTTVDPVAAQVEVNMNWELLEII